MTRLGIIITIFCNIILLLKISNSQVMLSIEIYSTFKINPVIKALEPKQLDQVLTRNIFHNENSFENYFQ